MTDLSKNLRAELFNRGDREYFADYGDYSLHHWEDCEQVDFFDRDTKFIGSVHRHGELDPARNIPEQEIVNAIAEYTELDIVACVSCKELVDREETTELLFHSDHVHFCSRCTNS